MGFNAGDGVVQQGSPYRSLLLLLPTAAVIRLSLDKLLVNLLQGVKRTNTLLIP